MNYNSAKLRFFVAMAGLVGFGWVFLTSPKVGTLLSLKAPPEAVITLDGKVLSKDLPEKVRQRVFPGKAKEEVRALMQAHAGSSHTPHSYSVPLSAGDHLLSASLPSANGQQKQAGKRFVVRWNSLPVFKFNVLEESGKLTIHGGR